jgi:hypothetical protein
VKYRLGLIETKRGTEEPEVVHVVMFVSFAYRGANEVNVMWDLLCFVCLLHMFRVALSPVSCVFICSALNRKMTSLTANNHLLRSACLEKLMVKH